MLITLDDVMRNQARRYAEKVEAALAKRPRSNYTGLTQPGRYEVGFLGELAFERVLRDRGLWYKHDAPMNGKSRKREFVVRIRGVSTVLDVKTAAREHYQSLLMPTDLADRMRARGVAYVVGARLADDRSGCEVLGYATTRDLDAAEIVERGLLPDGYGVRTLCLPFHALHPVEELLLAAEKVRAMVNPGGT